MASPSPETKNSNERLAQEQRNFEKTIRFFSDPNERQALQEFSASSTVGSTFAMPDGAFVHIGNAYPGSEAGKVEFSVSISAFNENDNQRDEPEMHRVTLPERFADHAAAVDSGQRHVIYNLQDLKGALDEVPEDVQWLVSTFGFSACCGT